MNCFSSIIFQLKALLAEAYPPHTRRAYPELRNFILDVMEEGRRKNIINLLTEVDATAIKQHIQAHLINTGEKLSLTCYLAHALARCVEEDKLMHAYRKGRSELVLFGDVDLAVMVERDIEGVQLPVVCIVRSANKKSAGDIQKQMHSAKSMQLGGTGPMSALEKSFFELPYFLRKIVWIFMRRSPRLFKQLVGTVGVTSMGMFSQGAGLVLPITPMTLTLSIGSIDKKLVLEGNQVVEREVLHLNLGADHEIVDGAPLMRFAEKLKKTLWEGAALQRVN
jgi:pyruvate/2-oxoglutarate dehydrogenase complex dihydrolipoamide acyltransferase (E2) component